MEFAKDTLSDILFENKITSDQEAFGIYRVPTSSGCLEFVKLYSEIPYAPHIHDKCTARFIFLTGKGYVTLDDEKIPYTTGSVVDAQAGVMHGFIIEEDTIFLSVQSNPIEDRETGHIDIRYE
jgi:quercetin dioxygenase-like cupin family protein